MPRRCMNAGGRENVEKARDALTELAAAARTPDARALYLLSQAQRRLGEFKEAEASARKVIAQNRKSPWGYYALAEALEARRQYQAVVDELAPVVAENRGKSARSRSTSASSCRISDSPIRKSGSTTKRSPSFEEARKLAPGDPAVAGYLIEANIAAKKYAAAIERREVGAGPASERPAPDAARGAGAAPHRQGR